MRFTRHVATINASEFRHRPQSLSLVKVRFNYSESLAELWASDCETTVPLRGYFADADLKRPLAIEDLGKRKWWVVLSCRLEHPQDEVSPASTKRRAGKASAERLSATKRRKQ
eukprot:4097589-Amphidinium_carterae.1